MHSNFHKKIEDLNLSRRAYNCLKKIGIETLGDIAQHEEHELFMTRNMGKKSVIEIEKVMENNGLDFGTNIENEMILPFKYKKIPLDYFYMMYGKSVYDNDVERIGYFLNKIKELKTS